MYMYAFSAIYCLLAALLHSSNQACNDEGLDMEYILAFMGTNTTTEAEVIFASPDALTVQVQTPSFGSSSGSIDFSEDLNSMEVGSKLISSSLLLSKSKIENKVIKVKGSKKLFVSGIHKGNAGCDGFLAFSSDRLGRLYYTVNHYPPSVGMVSAIVAGDEGAKVGIYTQSRRFGDLLVNGQNVPRGERILITLGSHQAIQVVTNDKFSGTKILSDKPVAVFSGNINAHVNNLDEPSGHLVEQLVPYSQWGTIHLVVPFPDRDFFYLKFVSPTPTDIRAHVLYRQEKTIKIAGNDPNAIYTFNRDLVTIRSTATIQVVLLAESSIPSVSGRSSRPAMTTIPPTTLYKKEYFFTPPDGESMTHIMLITIQKDKLSGLTLDGQQVDQSGWKEFPDISPIMVGRDVSVYSGAHWLKHPDTPFGVVLYGSKADTCTYAFPAGLCLPKNPDVNLATDFPTAPPVPAPVLTPAPSTSGSITTPKTSSGCSRPVGILTKFALSLTLIVSVKVSFM